MFITFIIFYPQVDRSCLHMHIAYVYVYAAEIPLFVGTPSRATLLHSFFTLFFTLFCPILAFSDCALHIPPHRIKWWYVHTLHLGTKLISTSDSLCFAYFFFFFFLYSSLLHSFTPSLPRPLPLSPRRSLAPVFLSPVCCRLSFIAANIPSFTPFPLPSPPPPSYSGTSLFPTLDPSLKTLTHPKHTHSLSKQKRQYYSLHSLVNFCAHNFSSFIFLSFYLYFIFLYFLFPVLEGSVQYQFYSDTVNYHFVLIRILGRILITFVLCLVTTIFHLVPFPPPVTRFSSGYLQLVPYTRSHETRPSINPELSKEHSQMPVRVGGGVEVWFAF